MILLCLAVLPFPYPCSPKAIVEHLRSVISLSRLGKNEEIKMIEIRLPSAQASAPFSSSLVCSGGANHLLLVSSFNNKTQHLTTTSTFLVKTLFPGLAVGRHLSLNRLLLPITARGNSPHFAKTPRASLLEGPVLWAGRIFVFYALLKAGLAGSPSSPFLSASDLETDGGDLGFSKWLDKFQKNPEKEAADRRKLVIKWHPTTKGTLKRNYRVPSKSEGRRLLKAIASLLSEDDHFIDATFHKGCLIRRESAHGESVCCNNVRALFDELPTPHLVVEITAFPAGPLSERDYAKAEKLERVLRSSPSV